MKIDIIDAEGQRDLASEILRPDGHLKIMPASFYAGTTQLERSIVANRHGLYGLHTEELVSWLREAINGRTAIEIGAGNGVLAQALNIPATDNRMQEWPMVQQLYGGVKQPIVKYGDHVEEFDAMDALRKYRPQVVIACWVTHKFDAAQEWREGNMWGVDEVELLNHCEEYIFVGNTSPHRGKPMWDLKEGYDVEILRFPWLYSRSQHPDNIIARVRKHGPGIG